MFNNMLEYFERTVENHPDKIAVFHKNETLTFGALKEFALKMADCIFEITAGTKHRPVCVFLPKSIGVVISDIATIYSSNFFNNLDIKTPVQRIQNIVDMLKPAIIVTNSKYLPLVTELTGTFSIINIEEEAFWQAGYGHYEELSLNLSNQIDTDPLCIINTSGSTGTPKGVLLTHRGFIDYVQWAVDTFNFDGSEVVGVMSAVVFDHYVYETCLMMTKGSALVLLDVELAAFPAKLLMEAKAKCVNYIFWVPTIMVNIANMGLLDKINLDNLKMVWFAGEIFPTRQFNEWKKHYPNATFVNLYGPCEISVDCTYHVINEAIPDEEPIPIGIPCKNTDVFLLNDQDKICDNNEIGEICVRGSSLAMGYYNNPEKTNSVFVQNPLNTAYPEFIYRTGDLAYYNKCGVLIFKGRKDSLIKHMGNRVELSEIEHIAVNTLKIIKNCCVVYNYDRKAITMFFEKSEGVTGADIRRALSNQMPKYMVPSDYIELEQLPRNTNGKIDRLKLSNSVNNK